MFADQIEQLKTDWTDKYVVVDATRPELKRFGHLVGQVKTVNMNGRALVEFIDYNLSTGWFDIDRECLKVVPKPEPKPAGEKKKPAAKPAAAKKPAADAGAKKLSPLEMARQQGAGGAAKPAAGKSSTADILAAARGGAAAAKSDKPAAPKGKASTADILAAARGGAAPAKPAAEKPAPAETAAAPAASDAPAKVDRSKMSVADMLAMARGGKPSGEAPAAPEPAAPPAGEAAAAAEVVAESSEPSDELGEIKRVDKSSMSVDEMIAHCRNADGR